MIHLRIGTLEDTSVARHFPFALHIYREVCRFSRLLWHLCKCVCARAEFSSCLPLLVVCLAIQFLCCLFFPHFLRQAD